MWVGFIWLRWHLWDQTYLVYNYVMLIFTLFLRIISTSFLDVSSLQSDIKSMWTHETMHVYVCAFQHIPPNHFRSLYFVWSAADVVVVVVVYVHGCAVPFINPNMICEYSRYNNTFNHVDPIARYMRTSGLSDSSARLKLLTNIT